ncbi:MAG: gamma-glutamyl-gamma-aminobutyrate hydrolase family protein [Alphaproteobacteria bacterium]|nr:gamma-glutamyl-gamma-aminobutyrate hydrolase family protein [Alphaproteobacteria bacterium]
MSIPLIGVSACTRHSEGGSYYHQVGHKYLSAVASAARGLPMPIPAMADQIDMDDLLDKLDGLFLTGSPSNVEPQHYNGPEFRPDTERDPLRDSMTLPLIRKALDRGLPIFAVCRGHQELNVVLGGTLHQNLQELPGKRDHRMRRDIPLGERYGEAHPVDIKPGGMLEKLAGKTGTVMVNSLHSQGIDRLADGLFVECVSDDGVIEAVSLPDAKGFLLSVQWHPEHPTALAWPLSQAMFAAFGDAARAYSKTK